MDNIIEMLRVVYNETLAVKEKYMRLLSEVNKKEDELLIKESGFVKREQHIAGAEARIGDCIAVLSMKDKVMNDGAQLVKDREQLEKDKQKLKEEKLKMSQEYDKQVTEVKNMRSIVENDRVKLNKEKQTFKNDLTKEFVRNQRITSAVHR